MNWPNIDNFTVATRGVTTKSALNPALWLCGLTTPLATVGSFLVTEPLNYILLFFAALPVLNAIRAFNYFMKHDPDRLQSERFLIERQVVAKFGDNSTGTNITLNHSAPIDNPLLEGGSN